MEFYDNLTDIGVFFFWIVIFLVIFLIVLSIVLYLKNKKLVNLIEKKEDTTIDNMVKEEEKLEDDILKIKEKKEELELEVIEIKEEKEVEESIKEEKNKVEISTPLAYQRNVLREMSRKMPISPIHIERSNIDEDASIYTVSNNNDDHDLDEMYLRDNSISPLEKIDDLYEANDSMKFASEIVSKMEEEMKPSNIELTDYEKKQEEEAIISYDELQKVKDKIYNITEDEETDEFIDELKSFRLDLK